MPAPSVWIANKGNHPYHHAEEFGTLKVLTEGRVNVFAVDNLSHLIFSKLDAEGREDDLLLVSGYAIPNMIAANWFLRKFGRVRLLAWGANRQKYMVLTMNDFSG